MKADFEKIPKRGRLLEGDGLESIEVDFKVDSGPDWEPVESIEYFGDAAVLSVMLASLKD